MITKSQKRKIVKAWKKNYSSSIMAILKKAKIYNRNGDPFSSDSIRRFVNGDRENERLEKCIMRATEKKLLKK